MPSIFSGFRALDAYAKTLDDFRTKTYAVTIATFIVTIWLILWEYSEFSRVETAAQLEVDTKRKEKMTIHFDIEFPSVPCFCIQRLILVLGADVMDVAGDYQNDVEATISKTRLSKDGADLGLMAPEDHIKKSETAEDACRSCQDKTLFDREGKKVCCNSCGELVAAFKLKDLQLPDFDLIPQCVEEGWAKNLKNHHQEGCRLKGTISVSKVPGNIHFAPGPSFETSQTHVHDLRPFVDYSFNLSHKIHYLSFGTPVEGIVNPLDNKTASTDEAKVSFHYYSKVVATQMNYLDGSKIHTNQFAVTQHQESLHSQSSGLPGVFFDFEISPLIVIYSESRKSLSSFITSVCAIVGGVFTIAKILDSLVYQAERRLAQKQGMGKAF